MDCPGCNKPLSSHSPCCQHCGFALSELERRLGAHTVVLERINDTAHCLRLKDTRRLETVIDDFERRLPQCFCSLYFGVLPPTVIASEAAFWLLNHGAHVPRGSEPGRDSRFGVVVVVDPASHTIALALGYGLERWVPHAKAAAALQKATQALWHSEYADAIGSVIAEVDHCLRSASSPTRRTVTATSAKAAPQRLPGVTPVVAQSTPSARRAVALPTDKY